MKCKKKDCGMESDTFVFGNDIFAYRWMPSANEKFRGIVQISHGMAEHAARYERFAAALVGEGFGVYANDHLGHGKTAVSLDRVGYFGDGNGWDTVTEDMHLLTQQIKENHPDQPVFLFGHSMGSLLSRTYITRYGDRISGVILSATSGDPGMLGKIGMLLARMERWRKGKKYRSNLLNTMSFGKFNKPFRPNRTQFDWLSRDLVEVDKYVDDPYCGDVFTTGFFVDLLKGIRFINRVENIRQIPGDLPVYLFSGEEDPVGDNTRGVLEVYESLRTAGVKDVSVKFYNGGRHEMLNEINRDEVYKDVVAWLNERCD
jgi:alpha-beta hydrolase superfamily lysophospholipase